MTVRLHGLIITGQRGWCFEVKHIIVKFIGDIARGHNTNFRVTEKNPYYDWYRENSMWYRCKEIKYDEEHLQNMHT
jgi:hypothetical protein